MKKFVKQGIVLTWLMALVGCSHSIHQLYVSSSDKNLNYKKGRWVSAAASDFVILGFQGSSDYVEQAYKKLEKKCRGRIKQVTTEFLTSYKFLSYDQRVILRGFCKKT